MLNQITPLILTYNEAPNLGRTLDRLAWARDIVIVDSLSTDDTRAIAARYPSARVFDRAFTSHAEQWNFGLEQTGIKTDWVLALDADFVLTEDVIRESVRCHRRKTSTGIAPLSPTALKEHRYEARSIRRSRCCTGGSVPSISRMVIRSASTSTARSPTCHHASCMTIANRSRTGSDRKSNTCASKRRNC